MFASRIRYALQRYQQAVERNREVVKLQDEVKEGEINASLDLLHVIDDVVRKVDGEEKPQDGKPRNGKDH